jgi:Na+/H+ antiporter NhaC
MPYLFWMAGLLSGVFLGWVIERRFVKFTTNVSISDLLARFLTGWLAFVFINYVCSSLLIFMLGRNWGTFFSTAVLGLYCIAIHPYLFTKFEKLKYKTNLVKT